MIKVPKQTKKAFACVIYFITNMFLIPKQLAMPQHIKIHVSRKTLFEDSFSR